MTLIPKPYTALLLALGLLAMGAKTRTKIVSVNCLAAGSSQID